MSISDRPSLTGTVGPRALSESLLTFVRALAFWVAVVLPFTYIPLLIAGVESTSTAFAFACLVVVNVLALVVSQPHRR